MIAAFVKTNDSTFYASISTDYTFARMMPLLLAPNSPNAILVDVVALYKMQKIKNLSATSGNRTPDICLEGRYFTTKLMLLVCLFAYMFDQF